MARLAKQDAKPSWDQDTQEAFSETLSSLLLPVEQCRKLGTPTANKTFAAEFE